MNKRDAINEILLSLNEMPLDVDDLVDDIQIATIIDKQLDITTKKILSNGWKFNTVTIDLYPNTLGYIPIPATFLSVYSSDYNVTVRDWKLFNMDDMTYIWEEESISCEIVQDIVFDDIPYMFANYIVQQASLESYINIIGNTDDISIRKLAVDNARREALRDDANAIKGNLLTDDYSTNLISRTGL